MRMREFIRGNREELDNAIQAASPGSPKNDQERELWILNDEGLYSWAQSCGVRI